jgi:hypothetical protein
MAGQTQSSCHRSCDALVPDRSPSQKGQPRGGLLDNRPRCDWWDAAGAEALGGRGPQVPRRRHRNGVGAWGSWDCSDKRKWPKRQRQGALPYWTSEFTPPGLRLCGDFPTHDLLQCDTLGRNAITSTPGLPAQ